MSVYGVKPSPLGLAIAGGSILLVVMWISGGSNERITAPAGMVSMNELLNVAIQAAEAGGDKVYSIRHGELGQKSKGQTKEGVDDPITMGDTLSHEAIVGTIKKAYGDSIFIYSEEKDSHNLDLESVKEPTYDLGSKVGKYLSGSDDLVPKEDVTIWVDPLDATKEYTENLLNYVTTMVCVAVKGKPVIGVIHKPFRTDNLKTVYGWVGHGSNIVDKSGEHPEKDGVVIVSRSHTGDAAEVVKKYLNGHAIGAGGAGYKVEELFGYPSDNDEKTTPGAYVHTTLIKKWDICSGNALLNHFGGKMTKLNGEDIDYHHSLSPKNEGGLVAALHDHQKYLDAFKEYQHPA